MGELDGITIFRIGGDPYTREDLMNMEPVCLRALLRERVHHTIEVEIYPIMLGRKNMHATFGLQAELIMDVWTERGFSTEDEDLRWCSKYIALAAEMRAGKKVELEEVLPAPFTDSQMEVVRSLIWERRSIRDWLPKPVPEDMIEKILEAGQRRAHRMQSGYCPLCGNQGFSRSQNGLERYSHANGTMRPDCRVL